MIQRDLTSILVKGLGKKVVTKMAEEAALDEAFYRQLIDAVSNGDVTQSMKASWILGTASDVDCKHAIKFAPKILVLLKSAEVGGVKRELLKTVANVKLKEKESGILLDLSFKFLGDPLSDLAIKYHAAANIERQLTKYPELIEEYLVLLEASIDMHTEAWRRYTLKRISKLKTTRIKMRK